MYTFKQINNVRKDTEYWFRKPLQPLFALATWINLNIIKAEPNTVSFSIIFLAAICALSFASGHLIIGALFYFFMIMFDAIDGATARVTKKVTRFGIFYDNYAGNIAFIPVIIGLITYFITYTNIKGIQFVALLGLLSLFRCWSAVHFANVTGGKYNFVTKKQVVRSKQTGLFANIRQVLFKYKIREPFAEKDMLILALCIGPLLPLKWFLIILELSCLGLLINISAWLYYQTKTLEGK